MTRKAIALWLITGSPTERFFKEAAVMFPVAFCSYSLICWRNVIANHFLVEDLWVTAACSAFGFGIVAAINGSTKTDHEEASPNKTTLHGVSSNN